MNINLIKYKIKQLFCIHDWESLGVENKYVDHLGNIVLVWKYKCHKCGKIKYKHRK